MTWTKTVDNTKQDYFNKNRNNLYEKYETDNFYILHHYLVAYGNCYGLYTKEGKTINSHCTNLVEAKLLAKTYKGD